MSPGVQDSMKVLLSRLTVELMGLHISQILINVISRINSIAFIAQNRLVHDANLTTGYAISIYN